MKNKTPLDRAGFALFGLVSAFRREKSFRTEVAFAVAVVVILIAARPPLVWAALVLIVVAMALAFELMNSSLEHLTDHLHPQVAPQIKIVKDVASAAVLVANCCAFVIVALSVWAWLNG